MNVGNPRPSDCSMISPFFMVGSNFKIVAHKAMSVCMYPSQCQRHKRKTNSSSQHCKKHRARPCPQSKHLGNEHRDRIGFSGVSDAWGQTTSRRFCCTLSSHNQKHAKILGVQKHPGIEPAFREGHQDPKQNVFSGP